MATNCHGRLFYEYMNSLLSDLVPLHAWSPKGNPSLLISGPCSAESRKQILQSARQLSQIKELDYLRAGVWKPRTRPNSFEGHGLPALEWLQEAMEETGLKTAIEVANGEHVEAALKAGISLLWVGARTTVNPFSVQEISDALSGVDVPVLVKNPISPDLNLWLGALERIHSAGIRKLGAVHRGFTSYDAHPYRNAPRWEIALQLKGMVPHLPVICDPSHIAGKRNLLKDVAQRALDLAFDGLMIESHPKPEVAWSDAEQQIKQEDLEAFLSALNHRENKSEEQVFLDRLHQLRLLIDSLDEDMLNLLERRLRVTEEIGRYKQEHNVTIFQLERWNEILGSRTRRAKELGLDPAFIHKFWMALHQEGIQVQARVMERGEKETAKVSG